jgi:hypothetical protein
MLSVRSPFGLRPAVLCAKSRRRSGEVALKSTLHPSRTVAHSASIRDRGATAATRLLGMLSPLEFENGTLRTSRPSLAASRLADSSIMIREKAA